MFYGEGGTSKLNFPDCLSNTHHHGNHLPGVDHWQLQHRGSLTSLFPLLIFSCQTPLFTHLPTSSTFCPINAQPLNQQSVYEKMSSHSLGIPGISYEMDWIRRDCLLNQNLHCNNTKYAMDHSRRAQYITKWTAFSVTQYTINFFGCLLRWVQVVKRKDHVCFDRITPIFKSEKALEKKQTKLKDIPMDGCRRSSKNLIKLVLPPACIAAQCDTHLCSLKTHQTRFLQPSQAARLGRAIVKKRKRNPLLG